MAKGDYSRMTKAPFWQTKPLHTLSAEEWESLCDGCGKCCVVRLEDADSGQTFATSLHCQLFDNQACRCVDYANRHARVPDCVRLSPDNLAMLSWMPQTCAYRLVHEGRDLPDWHPLKSGSRESVHAAGMSVRGLTVDERTVPEEDWEDYITILPGESR